jgi:hypothetical protein
MITAREFEKSISADPVVSFASTPLSTDIPPTCRLAEVPNARRIPRLSTSAQLPAPIAPMAAVQVQLQPRRDTDQSM